MDVTALILIITLTLKDVLAAPPSDINPNLAEDGRYYYSKPLPCIISRNLYGSNIYDSKTKNYEVRSDEKCCTYVESRNSCCLDSSTKQCKCDPTADCGSITTSAPTTADSTTNVVDPRAGTTTDLTGTTTADSTTVADTTADSTTIADTTADSTTIADTTVDSTTVADTTADSTTIADTTADSTTVADTTADSTTVADTTADSTTVADTTADSTTVADTTADSTTVADTTADSTTIVDTTVDSTTVDSTTVADTTADSTTTSTAAETTTVFKSLCTQPEFRILNGQRVTDDCPYSGIANITTSDGAFSACNAIYVVATVNGTIKPTFLTAGFCKEVVEYSTANGDRFDIQIGNQRYPIVPPLFTLLSGPDGTAFIDVGKDYIRILETMGACQKSACPYDENTMDGLVDFTNCRIVSWGTANSDTLEQDGLHEASVTLNKDGCTDIPDLYGASNTLCFKSVSGKNLFCAADTGAPVYCSANSNKEWIFIGVTALQTECDDTPEVKVLPFPG